LKRGDRRCAAQRLRPGDISHEMISIPIYMPGVAALAFDTVWLPGLRR
jgi:hypothetical protein